MRSRRLGPTGLAVLLLLALPRCPRVGADEGPSQGQRVFICGHSFHMMVAAPLADVARAAGIAEHRLAGTQGIGGSQVIQHWNVPDDANKVKKALRAGAVDVLTVAPHLKLPDEGIDRFTALALEHNPGVRVLVQASWAPFDMRLADRQAFKNEHRDAAAPETLLQLYEPFYRQMADQVRKLNEQYAGKQTRQVVYLVPVGHAVIKLRSKVRPGDVPGIARQSELFRDPIGHGQAPIAALAAYCHYAVIYGRNPAGLPVPAVLKGQLPAQAEAPVARLLQEIAWDAVTAEPLSGVKPARP